MNWLWLLDQLVLLIQNGREEKKIIERINPWSSVRVPLALMIIVRLILKCTHQQRLKQI